MNNPETEAEQTTKAGRYLLFPPSRIAIPYTGTFEDVASKLLATTPNMLSVMVEDLPTVTSMQLSLFYPDYTVLPVMKDIPFYIVERRHKTETIKHVKVYAKRINLGADLDI